MKPLSYDRISLIAKIKLLFFIRSSVNEYLGCCFCPLAIVGKTAMSTREPIPPPCLAFSYF
jgi:hypothetical protein